MTALPGLGPCPACRHDLSANVGGRCSAFVALPPGSGAWAGYCGCDCVTATGREPLQDGFARALRDDTADTATKRTTR